MYHIPVLLKQSVENLITNKSGIYVDLTFGGGGHSREILKNLSSNGILIAFDKDSDAISQAKNIANENFFIFKSNFRYFEFFVKFLGYERVDGIIADLGVSSYQIDNSERGFSTRMSGPLDMRMDRQETFVNAKEIISKYSAFDIEYILKNYGEIKNAKKLSQAILEERKITAIDSTDKLIRIIEKHTSTDNINKYAAQVFQALRMEVNNELTVLKDVLRKGVELLKPDGRFVVLSYHSLEDRLVKRYFNYGSFDNCQTTDLKGNKISAKITQLYKKAIQANEEEIRLNSRSRSVKLRVGVKMN